MSLQSYWSTSLPGAGYSTTSTLVSGTKVYAGCNGYVYLLDLISGEVLKKNSLSGYGEHEVRLAMSGDDSVLLVGIFGYIVGLDATSLAVKWASNLSASGYNVVNLLGVRGSKIAYATCNGSLYGFDWNTGVVKINRDFPKLGAHEARLALTVNADVLLVGIQGNAVGVKPSDLTTIWENNLPGSGYDITTVAGGDGCCYAICNGYLFMIDASNGELKHQNTLSGTGKAESKLALRDDGGVLFIGINGYGIAVKASDVSTIYFTSLPGCGYNVTDVVAGKAFAYYGCNGYVYSVDEKGNIMGTNALPGRGKHEVRLALDGRAEERLFLGINGYAMGILCTPPSPVGPWMAKIATTIGPKMLREIAIPGSHDSGTYGITALQPIGKDLPPFVRIIEALPLPAVIVKQVIAIWSIAQPDNFLTQLNAGVRYFDLRVQGSDYLCFVHGLESVYMSELFNQLSTFLSTTGNEKEVVILDFNHFYAMEDKDHVGLTDFLTSKFSDVLAVYNPKGSNKGGVDGFNSNAKLNDFWATKARIIVFYADKDVVAKHNFLWPQSTITSPWPDKANFADIKTALDSELTKKRNIPFVLQCQVTPDASVIVSGLAGRSYSSLSALAQGGNPLIVKWLNEWGPNKGINIVIADWITLYPNLIHTIIGLNGTIPSLSALFKAHADAETEQSPAITPNANMSRDQFIQDLESGSLSMADILERTHAEAFRVVGHNPSQHDVEALIKLQEYIEDESELGKRKLVRKPEVVEDDTV